MLACQQSVAQIQNAVPYFGEWIVKMRSDSSSCSCGGIILDPNYMNEHTPTNFSNSHASNLVNHHQIPHWATSVSSCGVVKNNIIQNDHFEWVYPTFNEQAVTKQHSSQAFTAFKVHSQGHVLELMPISEEI